MISGITALKRLGNESESDHMDKTTFYSFDENAGEIQIGGLLPEMACFTW